MIITKQQAEIKLKNLLPQDITRLANLFYTNGFDLFLVGGCIRDVFLGLDPKDFDVCTNALPDQIVEMLTKDNIEYNIQGEHFGVIVAKLSEQIEIATFRYDISSDTGNNKDTKVIVGATIEQDVLRRDLTINGLFMNLSTNTIIDLVGGIDDLKNNIIRCIGNPTDRFTEDNLRKLRVIRFASRLGFKIDSLTYKAIIRDPRLNISRERIVNELINSFDKCQNISDLYILLHTSMLLGEILPNIVINSFNNTIERTYLVSNFSSFLALIISNDNQNIDKKLFELKFDNNCCISVKVLLSLNNGISDPKIVKSNLNKTNLTKPIVVNFCPELKKQIEWIFDYKLPSDLSSNLIKAGFQGKQLGQQIDNFYLQQFNKL